MLIVKATFTLFIEDYRFHKQTSVGSWLCRIQFVYELILIHLLFSIIDNIFVRYRNSLSFSSCCL